MGHCDIDLAVGTATRERNDMIELTLLETNGQVAQVTDAIITSINTVVAYFPCSGIHDARPTTKYVFAAFGWVVSPPFRIADAVLFSSAQVACGSTSIKKTGPFGELVKRLYAAAYLARLFGSLPGRFVLAFLYPKMCCFASCLYLLRVGKRPLSSTLAHPITIGSIVRSVTLLTARLQAIIGACL